MSRHHTPIAFIGAGAIGTALGNILALKPGNRVTLHTVEEQVAQSINTDHCNQAYFPSIELTPSLQATMDPSRLQEASLVFLAIPSVSVLTHLESMRDHLPEDALLINLAKGFGPEQQTISAALTQQFPNPVCTLKGPSFAREIINRLPTGLTLGYTRETDKRSIAELFAGTSVHLDYTTDITGVEILSILKNIYAIALGIVDAQFDSPNLRFMVLTNAFQEMRRVLIHFGGKEATLFNYCGYGDFTLTALNDLSRNRTLGLLIGKGFFSEQVSHELVLEGKNAVIVFYTELSKTLQVEDHFPMIAGLYRIFSDKYPVSSFIQRILTLKES